MNWIDLYNGYLKCNNLDSTGYSYNENKKIFSRLLNQATRFNCKTENILKSDLEDALNE